MLQYLNKVSGAVTAGYIRDHLFYGLRKPLHEAIDTKFDNPMNDYMVFMQAAQKAKGENEQDFYIYYIYIEHLESYLIVDFQMSFYDFSCLGNFPYCVIPLFLEGSHPLPDQLPGEHTGLPSHKRQYPFFVQHFNVALICKLTHGRYKYDSWACSNRPHMFFYVHQSQT